MIDGLDHYNLCVPEPEIAAVADFYSTALGLTAKPLSAGGIRGVWLFSGDHAVVHVLPAASEESGSGPRETGRIDHVAFTCRGLAAGRIRLSGRGIPFEEKPYPQLGFTQLIVRDPVGVKIELNFADGA